ncbi:PfkB family carbohydrate kinase [Caldalkalibacillus mannanilyticus]|uniref:PfkB family carbohydrate kinase n=1 Tax=Caldalkalibacillus mannanilyticus TaxID=1418 RepID=UPI0004686D39|nr:PfkB family carbohydrate kinase [Caldalkalibacillus mannanilyticus]
MKIIAIGDNVVDCYLDQGMYYPGGNCVNVAVNCKRLGSVEVAYIGVFGTDDKAAHLKEVLAREGIDSHRSRIMEGISGQPQVNLTASGERVFVGGPRDTVQHLVKLKLTPQDYEYITRFDLCHSSCYSSLEEELSTLAKYIPISYDFSDKVEKEDLEKVCPYISYGFFSGSDLSEDQLEKLIQQVMKYNLEVIGITRGGANPAVFIYKGERYYQKPLATEVVDTMGAGDSFISGFLTSFLTDQDMNKALQLAAEQASRTCTFYGGFGYPKKIER